MSLAKIAAVILLGGAASMNATASGEGLERVALEAELVKTLSALMQNIGAQGETASALQEFVQSESPIGRTGRIVRSAFYKEKSSDKLLQIRLHKDDGLCYRDLKIHIEHVPVRGVIVPPWEPQPTRPLFSTELGEFDCE